MADETKASSLPLILQVYSFGTFNPPSTRVQTSLSPTNKNDLNLEVQMLLYFMFIVYHLPFWLLLALCDKVQSLDALCLGSYVLQFVFQPKIK